MISSSAFHRIFLQISRYLLAAACQWKISEIKRGKFFSAERPEFFSCTAACSRHTCTSHKFLETSPAHEGLTELVSPRVVVSLGHFTMKGDSTPMKRARTRHGANSVREDSRADWKADLFSNSRRGWLVARPPRVCLRDRDSPPRDEKTTAQRQPCERKRSRGRESVSMIARSILEDWASHSRLSVPVVRMCIISAAAECQFCAERSQVDAMGERVKVVNRKESTERPVSWILAWMIGRIDRHRRDRLSWRLLPRDFVGALWERVHFARIASFAKWRIVSYPKERIGYHINIDLVDINRPTPVWPRGDAPSDPRNTTNHRAISAPEPSSLQGKAAFPSYQNGLALSRPTL